ncbi:hypothetical protein B0293_05295 [Amycolatopsis azurea DSM 43854]|uniref:Pentapeptide repeat-containing protein n=1 Tax=Amycolatopsis azurea DSM 43854 TaxID=1238180 RepID=A0ABX3JNP5_9PSEU|nr:hypothetical protein B0293_05295 [Amycolatopsis azurea DSM 43854]
MSMVLVVAGGAGLASHTRRDSDDEPSDLRVISVRSIAVGGTVLLAIGITAIIVLLRLYGGTGPSVQLDAIRTAGTIVVGTGGAAALLLAARRQRSAELALTDQRSVARQTEHDAAERRITELYTKAVEQLGADAAPVRLGGLYALERLGRSSDAQRETILDVVCAYLRMPLPVDRENVAENAGCSSGKPTRDQTEERQVRLAAQQILHRARRPGPDLWQVGRINLRGADLAGSDLSGINLTSAILNEANLVGADLSGADLTNADLADAKLDGIVLRRTTLTGVVLDRTDLSEQALPGLNLVGAHLEGTNLSRADLAGVILRDAVLRGANLTEADLTGADLRNVTLRTVDTTRTIFGSSLSREQLQEVTTSGLVNDPE